MKKFFDKKKILITGGDGFLGSHLVEKLLEQGVPRENISAPGRKDYDFRFLENCEQAAAGQEIVIHTAAITGGIEFHRQNPGEIFYDNFLMGIQLMEAARRAGVKKMVSIGSATEYPENSPLPFKEENLWLGPPENIHFPYTIAKKMLLVQAQAYRQQYGFSAIHLILTNMYGPREKGDFVIPMTIKKIVEAKKAGRNFIEVWGTGRPTRDFLYVGDAVEAVLLAAALYDKPEPVNTASGQEISIRELVELIAELMDFQGEIRFDSSKPDGQMRRVLDTSRAEKEFGFRAKTHFAEGLEKTIEWHIKKNG